MTEDERRARIQEILDKHDQAFALMAQARAARKRTIRAIERVDTSAGTSIEGLRTVLDALAAANYANRSAHINVSEENDAVDRAIDLVREANRLAAALLNEQ